MLGMEAMPLLPGIPGVVAPDPKVTDGDVADGADGGDEHPASSVTASRAIRGP
jgi:hypothetical protein